MSWHVVRLAEVRALARRRLEARLGSACDSECECASVTIRYSAAALGAACIKRHWRGRAPILVLSLHCHWHAAQAICAGSVYQCCWGSSCCSIPRHKQGQRDRGPLDLLLQRLVVDLRVQSLGHTLRGCIPMARPQTTHRERALQQQKIAALRSPRNADPRRAHPPHPRWARSR